MFDFLGFLWARYGSKALYRVQMLATLALVWIILGGGAWAATRGGLTPEVAFALGAAAALALIVLVVTTSTRWLIER
jgi:hypothetical protein